MCCIFFVSVQLNNQNYLDKDHRSWQNGLSIEFVTRRINE